MFAIVEVKEIEEKISNNLLVLVGNKSRNGLRLFFLFFCVSQISDACTILVFTTCELIFKIPESY